MNTKTSKRKRDLKTKLMAAVAMLLVSSLMMVTSTYAWFTLSTAPEVTGITTAVGANGNLEMALLPTDGNVNSIKSDVGDSSKLIKEKNITWGNLVDLKEGYGLDQITLYPAALNAVLDDVTKNPKTVAKTGMLKIPTYGADGRVAELLPNTVTSTYVDASFPQNEQYGVRAIGTASGMTDRQLAYRNARSYALSAMGQAQDKASNSLSAKGSALADIAIKHGTGATTHTQAEVASLIAIIDDLLGSNTVDSANATVTTTPEVDGILEYIEESYRQYILAYGASKDAADAGMTDEQFMLFKTVVEGSGTLDEVIADLNTYGIELPDLVSNYISELKATKNAVIQARVDLEVLKNTGVDVSWTSISNAMAPLADPDQLEVNDIPAGQVKDHISDLMQSYADRSGLTVTMKSGAGVYADIADHCGDYDAAIIIAQIKYDKYEMNNVKARMETKTSQDPVYLVAVGTAVEAAGAPEGGEGTMPITDMYGYILDLAFRTNATDSSLLLQQQGVDRIYDESGNEETLGHGSSMTFKATTTDFSDEQVLALMRAIRIVFVTPGTDVYNVVATAKLDTAEGSYTKGADGITAMMYLYRLTAEGEVVYTQAAYEAGSGKEYYTLTPATYDADDDVTAANFAEKKATLYTEASGTYTKVADDATFAEGTTYYTQTAEATYTLLDGAPSEGQVVYTKSDAAAGEEVLTDNEIMALTQNTPTQLSVLVYLDGYHVTNSDVAATAATSVTGSMNLQFASSANLVPMEYADLHLPATATQPGETEPEGSEPDESEPVTPTSGTIAKEKVTFDGDQAEVTGGSFTDNVVTINFSDTTERTISKVTVDGNVATNIQYSNGVLTFECDNITENSNIVITI